MLMKVLNRRNAVAMAAALAALAPGISLAQAKLKVAGIYTVPFEQQWAGRLHTALKAARPSRRQGCGAGASESCIA